LNEHEASHICGVVGKLQPQEDFDEFQEFQGMEGPLAEPPHAKRPDGDALENTSGGIKFRLFALHSQVRFNRSTFF
jgi:hypothetical protein